MYEVPEVITGSVSGTNDQNGKSSGKGPMSTMFYAVCGDSQPHLYKVYFGPSFVTIQ
jgi:hypothetical protein